MVWRLAGQKRASCTAALSLPGLRGGPEWPHPRPTSQRARSRSENLQPGKMREQSVLIVRAAAAKFLPLSAAKSPVLRLGRRS